MAQTPHIRLDTSSYVPLYVQLATMLRGQIHDGQYQPGDQLPSEPQLARDHGVSRATALAALDELARRNDVYRVKGRGTFVAKPIIGRFSLSSSFSEDMQERGLTPTSITIGFDIAPPPADTVDKLGIPADQECFRLVRLRLVDGDPVALQEAYLPTNLYPELDVHEVEKDHLYGVMNRIYGLVPQWAEAVLEAHQPTEEEAAHLQITTADPVLVAWHLSFDDALQPLEFTRSVYRSDRFSFATGRQPVDGR